MFVLRSLRNSALVYYPELVLLSILLVVVDKTVACRRLNRQVAVPYVDPASQSFLADNMNNYSVVEDFAET
jgi:hypothetical protein